MEKYMKKYLIVLIQLFFLTNATYSQTISENEIKEFAKNVYNQSKEIDLGNGISVIGCIAVGRTLFYQYNVPDKWLAPLNLKEDLISNWKTIGIAKTFFLNNINVDFHYYKNNRIVKKISIKSSEFSNYSFKLGDYISINGHPKAKKINLKLKVPVGWEIMEGDRPNIVKKFVNGTNNYMILTKNFISFVSRKEAKEMLLDKEFTNEFVNEIASILINPQILNQNITTIDTYPAIELTIKGEYEKFGNKIGMIMKFWIIFYEDKLVFLQGGGIDNAEFKALEKLYNLITNSVIFPEQYN
jgi:hypothetical protein